MSLYHVCRSVRWNTVEPHKGHVRVSALQEINVWLFVSFEICVISCKCSVELNEWMNVSSELQGKEVAVACF
jgi:hypothetical protein